MKRLCYACKEQPARKLKTKRVHYRFAVKQAVFCSRGCAADWALLQIEMGGELALYFCKTHGWDDDLEVECGECDYLSKHGD